MNWGVLVLFVTLAVCFIIRMPISFSMMAASIAYFLVANPNRLNSVYSVITGNMIAGFTMLAAPLFVFMANVLNESEVTDKMFNFCNGLLGKMKGGTAQVNVLISLIFSGMTGSAIADASGIGLMEIQQMKKEGYDAEFSCAITAASATIGPIFPPSIPMVIYGMLSGASVGKLFIGGMVPGVLLAILLMIYCFFLSRKRNYPSGVIMTTRQFLRATLVALPALFTVVLLLGGIYGGVCTPTEAGALASAYALLIGCEVISRVLDMTDRNTCVLFGDGAGAAVLRRDEEASWHTVFGSRGDPESIWVQGPGPEPSAVHMEGKAVFRFAVEVVEQSIRQMLAEEGCDINDLDPGTLSFRLWRTPRAMWSTWGSGTAPSSAAARSWWRSPPPRP